MGVWGNMQGNQGMFCRAVNSRDKATPLPIIQDRILPGTCVMSDLWGAYDCQNDEDSNISQSTTP